MKKVTTPTTRTPDQAADPMGLLPALCAKLAEAYYAQLRAFLRRFLLVRCEPPALQRRILDAGTAQGGPVSLPATLTVYPRDATGFAPVVVKLETPFPEPWDEHRPDEQPDDPEYGPYINGLFGPVRRPKRGWRRFGRCR
jgi:hypothetical protein